MNMSNCRIYGAKPYQIALIHGGPGAAGSMQPCAQMLANTRGILEPIQTADTLEGQIEELRQTLAAYAELPVILIGHSWGAMLSYLFTARYPSYVKKLIMVASAVFDASYAQHIMETRLNRLSPEKRVHLDELENQLQNNNSHSDELFFQLGKMIEAADTFDPLTVTTSAVIPGQYHIYQQVWPQAEAMRATGELLTVGKNIDCPVVIIHGDYDPHPYQGVTIPLSGVLKQMSFFLLKNCGHEPWLERQAKDQFFNLLECELMS